MRKCGRTTINDQKLLDYLLNSLNLGKFSIIEALYFLDFTDITELRK